MKPTTITMIEKIRNYREASKLPIYFTLDAGPNIHLLYPKNIEKELGDFIKNEMVSLCENGVWIRDYVGDGPQKL